MADLHPLGPYEPATVRAELVDVGTRLALAQYRDEPDAAALADQFEELYRRSGLEPMLPPGGARRHTAT